jgi:hypothetical protein
MRLAVVVLSAVAAIEITAVGDVEAALERLAINQALRRFEEIIARELAADLIKELHGSRA